MKLDLSFLGALSRERRKRDRLTQGELAARIGVSQSQISGFEKGVKGSLGIDKIRELAGQLGIDEATFKEAEQDPLTICSGADCPTSVAVGTDEGVLFRPRFFRASSKYCQYCGDVLTRHCACGQPLQPGNFCGDCGASYLGGRSLQEFPGGRPEVEAWLERRGAVSKALLGGFLSEPVAAIAAE